MDKLPHETFAGIFVEMAEAARPNTHAQMEAQDFFKEKIMPPAKTPEDRKHAFWMAAAVVAQTLGVNTPAVADNSALLSAIEETSPQTHYTVSKVGKEVGAVKAPGWN